MYYLRTSSDCSEPQYFSGFAFSEDCMVLSFSGVSEYLMSGRSILDLSDGRYALCAKVESSVYFLTDRTGQDSWFYYKDSDFWAVSNSLYALAEKVKEKKGRLLLRFENAFMFGVNHSSGHQPYCNQTLLDGIRILPRSSYIEVSADGFQIKSHSPAKKIEYQEEYLETLHSYVNQWSSRIAALTNIVGRNRVRCDISGGVDSRIIMALTGPKNNSAGIKYASNKKWESDYRIADLLSAYCGFSINNSSISASRSLSASEALRIYRYGNAGVYRNVYYPAHSSSIKALHLHGGGGGNIRGLGGGSAWQFVHRLKQFFKAQSSFEKVKAEYLAWYAENDIDPRSDESTILHYRNFRGRFHFGRNWFRELVNPLITPLSSESAERMSDFLISKKKNPRVLQFDLLYLCDPFLAFFPFDAEEKSFRIDDFGDSMHYLSGLRTQAGLEKMNVFGSMLSGPEQPKKGDPDGVIDELCHTEVEEYLRKMPKRFDEEFPWLRECDRLRAYGFVSILKLLD